MAANTGNGERFLSISTSVFARSGICVVFSQKLSGLSDLLSGKLNQELHHMTQRGVNVSIYFGDLSYLAGVTFVLNLHRARGFKFRNIWIMVSFLDISFNLMDKALYFQDLHGSLSFLIQTKKRQNRVTADILISDGGITKLFYQAFHCPPSKLVRSTKARTRCTEKDNLKTLPLEKLDWMNSQDNYNIYNTVQVLARVLNAANLSRSKMTMTNRLTLPTIKPWQVVCHNFIQILKQLRSTRVSRHVSPFYVALLPTIQLIDSDSDKALGTVAK